MAVQPFAQEADAEEGTECYVRRTDRQPEPRRSDHRHCRRQSDREGARPVEPGDLRADGADEARPEQTEPEGDAERASPPSPERDRPLRLHRAGGTGTDPSRERADGASVIARTAREGK